MFINKWVTNRLVTNRLLEIVKKRGSGYSFQPKTPFNVWATTEASHPVSSSRSGSILKNKNVENAEFPALFSGGCLSICWEEAESFHEKEIRRQAWRTEGVGSFQAPSATNKAVKVLQRVTKKSLKSLISRHFSSRHRCNVVATLGNTIGAAWAFLGVIGSVMFVLPSPVSWGASLYPLDFLEPSQWNLVF